MQQLERWTQRDGSATGSRASTVHQEARARCEYLLDRRRPFGLIVGPGGVGKSDLLRKLASEGARGAGVRPILIDMTAVTGPMLLAELADLLIVGSSSRDQIDQLRRIRDRLAGLAHCQERQVLLLDHLDAARPDAFETLQSLLRLTAVDRSLSVIATARESGLAGLTALQQDFGWLQIDLEPLSEAQAAEAAREILDRAGQHDHVLSSGGAHELHRLTSGNPRQLSRLVELALLAREADDVDSVSPEMLRGVSLELVGTRRSRID